MPTRNASVPASLSSSSGSCCFAGARSIFESLHPRPKRLRRLELRQQAPVECCGNPSTLLRRPRPPPWQSAPVLPTLSTRCQLLRARPATTRRDPAAPRAASRAPKQPPSLACASWACRRSGRCPTPRIERRGEDGEEDVSRRCQFLETQGKKKGMLRVLNQVQHSTRAKPDHPEPWMTWLVPGPPSHQWWQIPQLPRRLSSSICSGLSPACRQ